AGFSDPVAITAISPPTVTLSPSATTNAATVPASKTSTSITALSVSTSAIFSPDAILSPSFFSHLTRVPSVIVSLSWGMVISAGMSPPWLRDLPVAGFLDRADDAIDARQHGFLEGMRKRHGDLIAVHVFD